MRQEFRTGTNHRHQRLKSPGRMGNTPIGKICRKLCLFCEKTLCQRGMFNYVLLIVSVNETKVQKRTKLPVRAQSENQIHKRRRETPSLSPKARGAACVDNLDIVLNSRNVTSEDSQAVTNVKGDRKTPPAHSEVQHFLSQQLVPGN